MDKYIFEGSFEFCERQIEDYTIETSHLGLMFAILDIHKMIIDELEHNNGLVNAFGRIDSVIKFILENQESIFDVKCTSDKEKHKFTLKEVVGNDENGSGISHNYSTEGNLSSEELFLIMNILVDCLKESLETEDLSLVIGVLREFEESNKHVF